MIAAAGSGQRLGTGGPKAFVDLAGRPMIEWSLLALAQAETIDVVVIAAPPGFEHQAERSAAATSGVPTVVLPGGESRARSVALALAEVESELVAVHDAARPLVTAELVDRVVRRLAGSGADGVIAAAPITDTLKRAGEEGSVVSASVDRSGLWSAQTPQAFRVEALRDAQLSAAEAGMLETATDEAWLLERAGGEVLLERSRAANLKVTNHGDLAQATSLLAGR